MEERPKQSKDSSENEAEDYDHKANPGEIFLEKWMGLSEKNPAAEKTTDREREKKHFTEEFKNTVFPRVVSKESARSDTPEDEVLYERTEEEDPGKADEVQFDKRHEAKNSQSRDMPAGSEETGVSMPAEGDGEPSNMHHISSVLGERARDIKGAKQPQPESIKQKAQTRSTLSYFLRPVTIGFLAAIVILTLVLLINLAV